MRIFKNKNLLILGLLCCVASCQAQSLLDLYLVARGYDALFQSAFNQLQASEARAGQSRAALLPQIGLQAGAQVNALDSSFSGAGSNSFRHHSVSGALIGSQPLYRPTSSIGWEQSRKQVKLAQIQLIAAEQDLIVRLSQAYFDVLGAADSLSTVRALKNAVAEQLKSARQNFERGTAIITDSREAQARFDLVVAQEIAAQNDLLVKQFALDQISGRLNSKPHPLIQPVVVPVPKPNDVNIWIEFAVKQHPTILQNRITLDVAGMEIKKAKTGYLPTVDLQATVGLQRYPRGNPAFFTTPRDPYHANNAGISIMLNWPLFSGFAVEDRVRETQALQAKAQNDLNNTERTISQAIRSAFFGVQSSLNQVTALQTAEQSSLSALETMQVGYQAGVRLNIDVLNAQSQLYQTRHDLAKARYDAIVGLLRLKQTAGTLNSADLESINRLLTSHD
ncbi:MAG: TolC family outer membrane protein [Burkholderiaceae bacterium]|jgi:outer membrane protein|nr:TolC family outer membrane protein [Burkholderiaceae bacterium]